MASYVEAQIQARIARVRQQEAERRRRRAELAAARKYGLRARKAAKLKRREKEGIHR